MKRKRKHKGASKAHTPPKTPTSPHAKALKWVVGALVLTAVVLLMVAAAFENTTLMYVSLAIFPATGILITPNVVRSAANDSAGWKSKFRETEDNLRKAGKLSAVSNMKPYESKLLRGVRREALWNFLKLTVVLVVLLVANTVWLTNGDSDNEMLNFIIFLVIATFGIPAEAYNISCSAQRIRIVKNRKYIAYRTTASGADGLNMWIIDSNDHVHTFDYCRRLGIRAKDVHNTRVVLVFVPSEVYLLPDNE